MGEKRRSTASTNGLSASADSDTDFAERQIRRELYRLRETMGSIHNTCGTPDIKHRHNLDQSANKQSASQRPNRDADPSGYSISPRTSTTRISNFC
jgi:hypothetical protein